jgi:hypothetical protein
MQRFRGAEANLLDDVAAMGTRLGMDRKAQLGEDRGHQVGADQGFATI